MFWQIITTNQLHKASQLFINYLENTVINKKQNNWPTGQVGQETNPQTNLQQMQVIQMIKTSTKISSFFSFTHGIIWTILCMCKDSVSFKIFPCKSSYFTSDLQQMQREWNQLEFQHWTCSDEFDCLRQKEFLKFYALAVQEMDTKFFACEVWPKLLAVQLPG